MTEYNFNLLKEAYQAYAKQIKTELNFNEFDDLIHYFDDKFNPSKPRQEKKEVRKISSVKDLIDATLRTNFYQTNCGKQKDYISLKFDSSLTEQFTTPKPMAEIFVYSKDVEAVHIRYGMVSRGGTRWSNRKDDYRTEVMGLVKTQQSKNSVIVPFGSKGAFYPKNPPSDKNEAYKYGVECYKSMVRGMLDITDNIINGKTVHPENVVFYDGEDPYLVVAADKGTAGFSDTANALSKEYNFWLGDAFASGGSFGYNHKDMAITSKGVWECTKRHFREMGRDIMKEDFTVIGIGSMAGDVFGNFVLFSKHTKLLAAVNSTHIFIDPNPDIAASYEERKRLFDIEGGWDKYDLSKISLGGGVFKKSDKEIKISAEMKKVFNIEKDILTPDELVKTILKADADMIYFGGIGTYVKNDDETDEMVKDKQNDNLRINASEIKAKVISEGANLAMTPKARVACALNGVKLNTDAVDNAGGVNCSDHEVNIKILLNPLLDAGKISFEERNKLIKDMEEDVACRVTKSNYLQGGAISVMVYQGFDKNALSLVKHLEKTMGLNRNLDAIPNDDILKTRPLSRPEIANLLSYTKNDIFKELLKSGFALECKYADDILLGYFPVILQKKYKKEILNHKLKNEIICMLISNGVVNRMGISFVNSEMEKTGKSMKEIMLAYVNYMKAHHIFEKFEEIEALDYKISSDEQLKKFSELVNLVKGNYLK